MSFNSGFFDAVDLGNDSYDRSYNAAEFAHYFSLLVGNGVFPNPATGMQVLQTDQPSMNVVIQPGSAWINGYYGTIPDGEPEQRSLAIANATLPRIDSIVVGLSLVNREVSLYVRQGSYAANPSPVALVRDYDKYEIELAQILVPAGSVSVQQQNITDCRLNTERCGVVTGTIDQIDTTEFLNQLTAGFNEWFENLQTQLSGDVAANLQLEIDDINSSLDDFVKFSAQTLTEQQKTQARTNIGSQASKIVRTVVLSRNNWTLDQQNDLYVQTVEVSGVTTDNSQLVQVSPSDRVSWIEAQEVNIYPPVATSGYLTFSCDLEPDNSITMIVTIWN